ncbi:MAG: hypothetical protein IPP48_09295 [Chitinophagaceae bacterium]|nr:hypothetical protein [Chitinophagaceae bacterium]
MNSVKLIFSIASMALLASCNSCKNSKQATATSTNTGATVNNPWLGETKWVFENYTKNPVAHLTTKPSLNFETVDEKTVSYSGKSFVNNYSGTLTVIKNVITKSTKVCQHKWLLPMII